MYEFSYENQGTYTYLVYKFGQETIDTMTLGMITNNKIKGLAKPLYTELNGDKYLKYNITAKLPLSKLFMGTVTRQRILGVFINIIEALVQLEDYMISIQSVIFDLNYIFADVSTSEIMLVCVPVISDKAPVDLREFFKGLMFSLNFDTNENGDYIAKIIAYLNSAERFSLMEYKMLLENLQQGNIQNQGYQNVPFATGQQNVVQGMAAPMQPMQALVEVAPMAPAGNAYSDEFYVDGPNIQNIYVGSSKADKLAKRTELQKKEAEQKAQQMKTSMPDINANMGFAVPGMPQGGGVSMTGFKVPAGVPESTDKQKKKTKKEKTIAATIENSEEDISLGYLLQHYSKENAQKYKATKERKKQGDSVAKKQEASATRASALPQTSQTIMIPQQSMQQPYVTSMQTPMTAPQPMMRQSYMQQMTSAPQPMQQMAPVLQPMQQPAPASQPMQQPAPALQPMQQPAPALQPMQQSAPASQSMQPVTPAPQPMRQPAYEPAIMAQDEDPQTSVLIMDSVVERKLFLYRCKNGEKVYINKAALRIGKNSEVVDFCISDNSAISRCHAVIYNNQGTCSVEDTNSTNGTYVNDEKIVGNTKVELRVGSRVRFADEEFELRYE